MTEAEMDQVYAAKDKFMVKVREAFREMKRELPDKMQQDAATMIAQDQLSLYSPWMAMDE